MKKTYNEFYRVYSDIPEENTDDVSSVIVEDTNSGYDFFNHVVRDDLYCVSAGGKSGIVKEIRNAKKPVAVVADGAAFGSEMNEIFP